MSRRASSDRRFALLLGRVDCWFVALADMPAGAERLAAALLSSDERERASRFHFERDWRNYVRSHMALRLLLARYLAVAPAALVFAEEPGGRPILAAPAGGLHFNLSHSGDAAMAAVARDAPVGVDIEAMRDLPDFADIAESHFAPSERESLFRLDADRQLRAFYVTWTRKEAFVKALGVGLSFPLEAFGTGSQNGPQHLTQEQGEPYHDWTLADLALPDGYAGAVALQQKNAVVRCEVADWRWMLEAVALDRDENLST